MTAAFACALLFTTNSVVGSYFPVLVILCVTATIPLESLFAIKFPFLFAPGVPETLVMFFLYSIFFTFPLMLNAMEAGEIATTTIDPRFFEDVKLLDLGDPNLDLCETFNIFGSYIKTARLICTHYPELEPAVIKALWLNSGNLLHALPVVPV